MQLKKAICIEKVKHVIHIQNTSNDNDCSVPEIVALTTNNSNEIFIKTFNRFNKIFFQVSQDSFSSSFYLDINWVSFVFESFSVAGNIYQFVQ